MARSTSGVVDARRANGTRRYVAVEALVDTIEQLRKSLVGIGAVDITEYAADGYEVVTYERDGKRYGLRCKVDDTTSQEAARREVYKALYCKACIRDGKFSKVLQDISKTSEAV